MIIYDEPHADGKSSQIRITEAEAIVQQRRTYNRMWCPLIPFEIEDDKLLEDFLVNNGAWRED